MSGELLASFGPTSLQQISPEARLQAAAPESYED